MRARLKASLVSLIKRQLLPRGLFRSRDHVYRATGVGAAHGSGLSGAEIPVVVSVWSRPYRIDDLLDMLDAQIDVPEGIVLHIWNNTRVDQPLYESRIRAYRARGALRAVRLARSPSNLGGMARFYWAKKIARARRSTPVIIIDDDQQLLPHFVSTARAAYRPGSAAGWSPLRLVNGFARRRPAQPDDRIDVMVPGGMIFDPSFLSTAFFAELPDRFWFLDDIWFTHRAIHAGLQLRVLPVDVISAPEPVRGVTALTALKNEFFDQLWERDGLGSLPEMEHFDAPEVGSGSFVQADDEADVRYTLTCTDPGEWVLSAEYLPGATQPIAALHREAGDVSRAERWELRDVRARVAPIWHDTWRGAASEAIARHADLVHAALEARKRGPSQ